MVIINENIGEISVNFPRNTDKNAETYELTLHGSQDYTFGDLVDGNNSSLYYAFTIDFTGIPDAEYEYIITGDGIQEQGLLRIGSLNNQRTQYQSDNAIIQYE